MAFGVSDEMLGTFVPIIAYWAYACMYEVLGPIYLEKYRLHTKEEEEKMNMITKGEVVRGVLLEQLSQVAFVLLAFSSKGKPDEVPIEPTLPKMALQFIIAMIVMDTWQYFTHRMLHIGFLYKYIHSKHHRLVVPYAFGALYNQPLEGILIDTVGGILAFMSAGMTPRTAMYFLCFAGIKTVDDHCGYWIPWHPLQMLFTSNSACHGIHHHLYGNKFNYAAPFFITWDKVLGTYLDYKVEKREGGGYHAKIIKKNKNN